jgi:uncharacterized delta-60 repeat protein
VFNLPGEQMRPRAIAVQPDGRIVVAGYLSESAAVYPDTFFGRALVVRFLRNGALDPTFADGGVARIRLRAPVAIAALTVHPDGALLLGGTAAGGPGESLGAVARLLPNGAVDESFGSGGLATVRAENIGSYSSQVFSLSRLAAQPDGRIVAAGSQSPYDVHSSADPFVVRLLPNGAPDASFDGNGAARAGGSHATAVLAHPDGHMIVASWSEDYFGGGALSALRISMGADDFPQGANLPADVYGSYRYERSVSGAGAEVQADGSVVIAGQLQASQYRAFLAWVRIGPGLELLDRGKVRSSQGVQAATFDSRGALLTAGQLAGYAHGPIGIQRYRGRRFSADRSFGGRTGKAFVKVKDPAEPIGISMQGDRLLVAGYTRSEPPGDQPLTLFRLHANQDGSGPIGSVRGLPRRRCGRGLVHALIRIRDESRIHVRVRLDRRVIARSRRERLRIPIDLAQLESGPHKLVVTAVDAAGNLGRFGTAFRVCPAG